MFVLGLQSYKDTKRSEKKKASLREELYNHFIEIKFQQSGFLHKSVVKTRVSMVKTRKAIERVGQRQVFLSLDYKDLKRLEKKKASLIKEF